MGHLFKVWFYNLNFSEAHLCSFVQTCLHACLSGWYSLSVATVSSEYSDYLGSSQQPSEKCPWCVFPVTVGKFDVSDLYLTHCVCVWSLLLLCLYRDFPEMDEASSSHHHVWVVACLCIHSCVHGWSRELMCMKTKEQDSVEKQLRALTYFIRLLRFSFFLSQLGSIFRFPLYISGYYKSSEQQRE